MVHDDFSMPNVIFYGEGFSVQLCNVNLLHLISTDQLLWDGGYLHCLLIFPLVYFLICKCKKCNYFIL